MLKFLIQFFTMLFSFQWSLSASGQSFPKIENGDKDPSRFNLPSVLPSEHFSQTIFEKGEKLYTAGDMQGAFSCYMKAALMGNSDAELMVAWCYENGKGVEENDKTAASWYSKSAKNGNSKGMNYLGTMYEDGVGVPQNWGSAYYWYQKSASLGDKKGRQLFTVLNTRVNAIKNGGASTTQQSGSYFPPISTPENKPYYNPVYGTYQSTPVHGWDNGHERDLSH